MKIGEVDRVPSALIDPTSEQIASAAGLRYAPGWLRRYLLERDRYRCHYCKAPVTDATANMDHVKPWPMGLTTPDNLVVACKICNYAKKSRKAPKMGKSEKRLARILNGLHPNAGKGKSWRTGMPS